MSVELMMPSSHLIIRHETSGDRAESACLSPRIILHCYQSYTILMTLCHPERRPLGPRHHAVFHGRTALSPLLNSGGQWEWCPLDLRIKRLGECWACFMLPAPAFPSSPDLLVNVSSYSEHPHKGIPLNSWPVWYFHFSEFPLPPGHLEEDKNKCYMAEPVVTLTPTVACVITVIHSACRGARCLLD